jgi:hypothetical protein
MQQKYLWEDMAPKATWLFQGNPDQFRVDEYILSRRQVFWKVQYPKYEKEIQIGDTAYLWRSQGKSRRISGVVAKGTIIERCRAAHEIDDIEQTEGFVVDISSVQEDRTLAKIALEEVRLSPEEGMIQQEDFKADLLLQNSQIIKGKMGSCFRLSPAEADRIDLFWQRARGDSEKANRYQAAEGALRYEIHKIRERDPKLKTQLIQNRKQRKGTMVCDLCKMDPKKVYGKLGEELLQLHHLVPLGKLSGNSVTSLEDVILVCPNCHAALHHGDAEENVEILRKLFQSEQ